MESSGIGEASLCAPSDSPVGFYKRNAVAVEAARKKNRKKIERERLRTEPGRRKTEVHSFTKLFRRIREEDTSAIGGGWTT